MLDFIQLGLNIKHKIKIYISSTHKKQSTMHSGRQTKPLILFNEFYTVSQKKTRHQTLGHNFTNYYPISKIFSLANSAVNLQQIHV